jgi:O-antigen/teichoic acid export membrane protein
MLGTATSRRDSAVTASPVKRPGGVTFLGVLVVISGILYVISGLLAILASTSNDLTSNQKTALLVVGIVILLIGIVELAVARGLFRGNNGARLIVAILNVLTIVAGLFALFQSGNQRGASIGQVVIAIIVLALLYSSRANEFFNRGRTNAGTY